MRVLSALHRMSFRPDGDRPESSMRTTECNQSLQMARPCR